MVRRVFLAATVLSLAVVLMAAAGKKGERKGKKKVDIENRFAATDEQKEEIRALLTQHDEAFTNHDIKGVMATYAGGPRTVVMGTGPGELWVGKEEIRGLYTELFKDFDKGKQDFKYDWRQGGIQGRTAWLNAMGEVHLTKDGEEKAVALNASCILVRIGKNWRFVNFHFSTFGGQGE